MAGLNALTTEGYAVQANFKNFKPLKRSKSLAAASTKPSGHKPLLFQRCSLPFASTA